MKENTTKELSKKLQNWADFFQYGTIGFLIGSVFLLETVDKETARVLVWYIGGFLLITAIIGYVLANKALKARMKYLNEQHENFMKKYKI